MSSYLDTASRAAIISTTKAFSRLRRKEKGISSGALYIHSIARRLDGSKRAVGLGIQTTMRAPCIDAISGRYTLYSISIRTCTSFVLGEMIVTGYLCKCSIASKTSPP